jgi:hypothetical protein
MKIGEYMAAVGKKGGKSKSKKKRDAARRNLEKALAKRWGKKIKLFDKEKVK